MMSMSGLEHGTQAGAVVADCWQKTSSGVAAEDCENVAEQELHVDQGRALPPNVKRRVANQATKLPGCCLCPWRCAERLQQF